jgi:hypothetical protein
MKHHEHMKHHKHHEHHEKHHEHHKHHGHHEHMVKGAYHNDWKHEKPIHTEMGNNPKWRGM